MNNITTSKREIVMYQADDAIRLENADIESLIRTIRGQKVMVDFDLSMLYGVKTKVLNQSVKRNIKRFPDDFMFQLTNEEWNNLRSQFVTTKDISKIRTLPYAFTREGIGMLSSILGSDTAIEMNIRIMRVFTAAHQIMEKYVSDLVRSAKERIILIDNFVDDRVLSLLDKRAGLCAVTEMQASPETILELLK